MGQDRAARFLSVAGVVFAAAFWIVGGGGCGRAKPSSMSNPPRLSINLAEAEVKSKSCRECHNLIDEFRKGDKHAAAGIYCVVCHGESVAHVEQETEGALPDRAWRRWVQEENRFEWRVEKATLEIARFCVRCHVPESPKEIAGKTIDWPAYLNSKHGQAVSQGDRDAPTCTGCHRPHETGTEPWTDETIVETCAICHNDKEMMKRAGLSADVVRDFKAGEHAIMGAVPPEQKSSCIKCHLPHG